ncbi:hypothetical protein A2U01_0062393, partial [Trifolium medium]|nr:hypothetical protein [Trifolium medium]
MLHFGTQPALELDTFIILSFWSVVIRAKSTQRFKLRRILHNDHIPLLKLQEFHNLPISDISWKILHPELPFEHLL